MSPASKLDRDGFEDLHPRADLPYKPIRPLGGGYPLHGPDPDSTKTPVHSNKPKPSAKPSPTTSPHASKSPAANHETSPTPVPEKGSVSEHGAESSGVPPSAGPTPAPSGVPSSGAPPPGAQVPPTMMPLGPPYPPMYATLGGLPTPTPDVPLSAVFLILFFIAGVAHMKIFKANKAKSHKFVFSGAIFAFCMIRVISTGLRIGWAHHQHNVKLGIAAMIFTSAGIVILYITNLFFTQRLLYARHPGTAFKILVLRPGVIATVLSIILVIIATVQSFFTLNPNTHRIDRDVQLYALTFFTFVAVVPLITVVAMILVPREGHIVKVPSGKFSTNALILLVASTLLTLGAGWKCGTNWEAPVPLPFSPWYYSKPYFYIFNFTVEFLVVLLYLIVRVDRRFYVPARGEETTNAPGATSEAPAAGLQPPTGFASPAGSAYTTASEKTTFEEKLPLFLQLVLEVDPDTGKYQVGHNPILQELNRGRSKGDEKTKPL